MLAAVLVLVACTGPSPLSSSSTGPGANDGDRFASVLDPNAPSDVTTAPQPPLPVQDITPQPSPTPPAPTATPEPTGVGGLEQDPRWDEAIQLPDGAILGQVATDVLNIRSAPRLDALIVEQTYHRHTLPIYDEVLGDPVDGNPRWYRVGIDRYVSAVLVEPLIPTAPPETFEGNWVDINLSTFYAVAYNGATPVYAALITAGREGKTPIGTFEVLYRVRNETMDSATVGIEEGEPGYYYLENVQYTQYFAPGGFAIHENYWTPAAEFGGVGSNGCIGLLEHDAAWLWNFLGTGSVVNIHY